MASASRSSSHVTTPFAYISARRSRRSRLKALVRAIAAVIIACTIVSTAMMGAAWALAVSLQARSDIRSSVASVPQPGQAWQPGPQTGGLTIQPKDAPDTDQLAVVPPVDLPGTFALFAPKPIDAPAKSAADPDSTGSLGTVTAKATAPDVAKESRVASIAPEQAPAAPLPRPRPKLASLTPLDGVGVKPQDEVRAPRTAIYDISARIVYLPNGEKLEAHSGLGQMMDNPRYVNVRMRGATPPNVYNLRLREAMFHGVQAIRLLPENEHDMFGRAGILAHTYMLGPNGQSNGCVSFREYPKFLRAYQRGEIDRLIVVPHLATPPVFASRTRGAG